MKKLSLLSIFGAIVASSVFCDAFVVPPRHRKLSFFLSAANNDDANNNIDSNVGIDVAQQVHPSTALVIPMGVRQMKNRGSGFVVEFAADNDAFDQEYLYLITAAHVAAPGYKIGLSFPGNGNDNTPLIPASVVGRNTTLDLALLRIDRNMANDPTPLKIASELPPVGTTAFAHGYPASRLRGPAMTCGIVCGIADGLGLPEDTSNNIYNATTAATSFGMFGNDTTTFVVTDAAMSGGMSGGPLTDAGGTVLGVNALVRPDLRALGNYAVSSEEVNNFLEQLRLAAEGSNTDLENDGTNQKVFQVFLFNDPMNKRARVSSVLREVAKLEKDNADQVMMQAHTTGSGLIGQFENRTVAEELCQSLRSEDLLVEVQ